MKTSKDLSSTSEAEQITSPTAPDRQSSLAIRLDRNTAAFEKKGTGKGKLVLISSPERLKHPCSPLAYDHMQYLVLPTPAQNPETHGTERCWTTDDSDVTSQLWGSRVAVFCLRMDTLNGMCVCAYTVCEFSESFFSEVDFFEDDLHSRKIDPLFFSFWSLQVLHGRTLCLEGYY